MTAVATITCPECAYAKTETMPADACQHFYRCEACGVTLSPLPGDCCVFCSYSDQICPPKQAIH
ncbi:MAG: GDCCVxC domain-containing (seleno)protein [Gaiellaceae bacterium]